ncbi:YeeE/YedE thiosulfate transporter family protein [soil metagenome]
MRNLKYLLPGFLFGLVFVKAELISWFRMQEMFRFHSWYLYLVLASAMFVAMSAVFLIKKFNIRTLAGDPIVFPDKVFHKGYVIGGLLFGIGWALTGSCSGPLFAQIGAGYTVLAVSLLSAVAGTWVYGYFRDRLPQ